MTQPCPLDVPPALLDRDSLSALQAHLLAHRSEELRLDLAGLPRLSTPAVQILLAALRDGVRLRLAGADPGVLQSLALLGLAGAFPTEGQGA